MYIINTISGLKFHTQYLYNVLNCFCLPEITKDLPGNQYDFNNKTTKDLPGNWFGINNKTKCLRPLPLYSRVI